MDPALNETTSLVKWQRHQKKLRAERLLRERAALPILGRDDIIAYRLPFHEGLIRRLDKSGYKHSAEYIRQLIEFQEESIVAAGDESIIWQRPRLKYQNDILETLREGLKRAEDANKSKDKHGEIDEILKLAVEYCFGSESWWWLGHQLLMVCQEICGYYLGDHGKRKAFTSYLFGRFLFDNLREPDEAFVHLNKARKLSSEMIWNVREVLKGENCTVFADCCRLLFLIDILEAKNIMQKDPNECILLCEKARRRALEGCYYEGVIETFLVRGICQMNQFDTGKCIESFQKALRLLEKHPNVELKCQTLRRISIAYLKHGNLNDALKYLSILKDYAYINDKLVYIAQAYQYLGKFYLKEGTAANATQFLSMAIKLFNKLEMEQETANTRNITAISIGVELMPMFCKLIITSDKTFSEDCYMSMKKLLDWKDNRVQFTSKQSIGSDISSETAEIMTMVSTQSQFDITVPVEKIMNITPFYEEHSTILSSIQQSMTVHKESDYSDVPSSMATALTPFTFSTFSANMTGDIVVE